MCISPERFILLDTQVDLFVQSFVKYESESLIFDITPSQPVLSPSVLMQMMRNDQPLSSDMSSHENLQELQSLQLAVFMLSVCHVVIIATDAVDINFWKFFRTVEMLKYRIPDVAAPNGIVADDHNADTEYYPDVGTIFFFFSPPPLLSTLHRF